MLKAEIFVVGLGLADRILVVVVGCRKEAVVVVEEIWDGTLDLEMEEEEEEEDMIEDPEDHPVVEVALEVQGTVTMAEEEVVLGRGVDHPVKTLDTMPALGRSDREDEFSTV